MPEQEMKTVVIERDEGEQTLITCDHGAAMIMRVYEDGDVSQMAFNGPAMDKICKTWQAYKASGQQALKK